MLASIFPSSPHPHAHKHFDCWQSTPCVGVLVPDTHGPRCRIQAIPSRHRGPGPLLRRLTRECFYRRECWTSFNFFPQAYVPVRPPLFLVCWATDFILQPVCSGFGPGSSDAGSSHHWRTPSSVHATASYMLPSPDRTSVGPIMSDYGAAYFPSS